MRVIDLARPLRALDDLEGVSSVRVYLSVGSRIMGWLWIADPGRCVSVPRLRDAVVEYLSAGFTVPSSTAGAAAEPGHVLEAFLRRKPQAALEGQPVRFSPSGTRASPLRLPDEVPVSIVVATLDRPDDLRRCLSSVTSQRTGRRVEIVVVDNNPTSGLTPPVVADFTGVRLVEESRRGLSYARNAGFAASGGELLVTTDDDVVAPPEWLELLLAPFARNDVAIVTGNVLPLELEPEAQPLFEAYGGLSRRFEPREVRRPWFDSFRARPAPTWLLGATANAALRRSILDDPEIGPFREELGPGTPTGCGEDTFLFYRVLRKGYTIVYEPSACVRHRHRSDRGALRRQRYAYGKGHVAYHLQTLLEEHDLRALSGILLTLPWGQLVATVKRLAGRGRHPLTLIALEVLGNVMGPWALLRSRLRVRRLGRVRRACFSFDRQDESVADPPAASTS